MEIFHKNTPTLDNYWRSIILFGKNTASYKFALGKSILELSENPNELLKLEDLAPSFSSNICKHLINAPKQSTISNSSFLDACRKFNNNEITKNEYDKRKSEIFDQFF